MRPLPESATSAAPRPAATRKRPYHVVTFVGASAVTYAMALGLVTQLQVDADKQRISDLDPMGRSIRMLDSHHDGMDSATSNTRQSLAAAVAQYNTLIGRLSRLDDRVSTVGDSVSALNADLAAQIAALQAPSGVPPAKGGSGASGGGGATGGGAAATARPRATAAPIVAPAPAPAPTPHATTKPSVKP